MPPSKWLGKSRVRKFKLETEKEEKKKKLLLLLFYYLLLLSLFIIIIIINYTTSTTIFKILGIVNQFVQKSKLIFLLELL